MTSFEPVDSGVGDDGGQGGQGGGHPAWQEFIGDAPQEVVEKYISPAFSKWDQNVNSRFQQVQQQYKPWEEIVKTADPETAGFAINFLNALNNNPAEVIKQVSEHYKLNDIQGTSQGQTEPKAVPEVEPWAKDISRLQQQNEIMAQALLQRHQQEEAAQADAWVNQELDRLTKANAARGPFNDNWVCAMAGQANVTLDDAVKMYYEWEDQVRNKSRPRPLISGGGGGAPGAGGINVKKLDNKATNNLIVDILNANNAQRDQ